MNKIFKIVWNNSIGSYTVVSELTKSKSKGATCTTVAAVMLLAVSPAWGAQNTGTTTSGGNTVLAGADYRSCYFDDTSKNVVCGDASTTAADVVDRKPGKSVAIGLSAKTAGESNVALGANSSASSTSGLAIGSNSKAHNNQTVAIGERANALNEADIAIGKAAGENATSTHNEGRNIAVGEEAVKDAVAVNNVIGIGTGAAKGISGSHVIAIGTDANQGVSGVNQVVAIGYKSSAETSQSVAIGTSASAKQIGALALGNSSNAVTESSVAVGRFAQASGPNSIAVGGGRSAAQSAQAGGVYSIAVGAGAEATGPQSTAMGRSAVSKSIGTVAVGDTAQASNLYAIAIGNKAEASGDKSVAIGSNEDAKNIIARATGRQSVAIGWTAQATGATQSVAIGPDTQALGAQSTSIGNNTRAKGNSSIAIGGDDWNLARAQVGADYQRLTGTAMRPGFQGTEAAEAAVAVGVKAMATGVLSTAFGPGAQATEVGASAFGVGAEADKEKAVAIGAGSRTSTNATAETSATVNSVTYGGFAGATHITDGSQVSIGTAGYERQIKHVAPGAISATSTDAINGSQLYHVAAQAANPLKFDGDSGTTVERPLGTTLNVKGGATGTLTDDNIGVVADKASNTLRVKLAQNVDLGNAGSLKTGDTTVNNNGLTITGGPSVTNTGIDAGNKQITNIADGAADTDAASFKQVKAAKTEVQAGTNVASVTKTDGTNGQAIYTVNAKAAAVALENGADGLKLTSSEDTTTNVTTYKLDLADKTKTSLAKADSALQNIGVQVNGTAAKTLNQANSTLNFVNGTGTTAENKNGNIAFNVNKANLSVNGGTVSADKNGDEFATAKSVADAINQAVTNSEKTSVVAAGDNTHVASAVSGNQTTYTVHADKTTVSAKTGGKLTVASAQTANGNQTKTTNYELDLTDDAKAEIQKGVDAKTAVDTQGIGFAADSGSPVTKKLGDSLNIKGDNKNITTKINNGDVQVTLNDDISVQNVTAAASVITPKVVAGDSTLNSDGLKISNGANPVELTKSGLNNGGNKITNVAKGTADTDAVNLAQLKDAAAAASNKVESGNANIVVKPVNNADGSTTYKVATADKLTADSFTAGNTVVNNGGVKVGNAVALGNDGLKAGNVSVGTNGINAGNHAVKNVAKGVNDTDAVNVAQLREQIAAGVKTTTVVAGKNVTVSNKVNGNNTEYTVNAEKTTVSAAAGGAVKVNAGTKNADGVTDYAVDLTDAAKADIAKGVAAKNTVDNKGLTFNADGSTTTGVKKLGDTVAINGDGNIITKADANGIQIGLNKNLNVQSVKAGNTTLNNSGVAVGGNVALTQNGLKAGNVNVSASGIDAGGNKITRVAPGVVAAGSTDAVNGGQLYAANQAARAAKTEVVAGKNIVVTESQGANGQSVYQVATSDNLTVGSVKAGATTVNDRGISIALPTAHDPENAVSLSPNGLNNGGQRISNVAPGRVGTDAVNLNQLAGLGNALQNNIDRVGKKAYSGVAGAIAQGSIPQVTRPGATGIGVGSGYYGGQSAMAIGVSAMSDGGNWIVKGNFSANTGGHVGVGAGALYQW